MERQALEHLKELLQSGTGKPIILRGARQVGKSTLVRLLCEEEGLDLVEFNLEIERLRSIEGEEFALQSLLDEIQLKKM